jgi:serine-type D-Ala-D-Ala carboxypeptidase (penicillin-binding protein 5/6)
MKGGREPHAILELMMRPTARRGRLYPVLVFVAVLAVTVVTLVGVAQGASTTTTVLPTAQAREASFTVNARDLGDFSVAVPAIQSPAAIVVNMGTGKVLYEWDAYERRPMASTTKIMTAALILEKMGLTEKVVVSEKAAATVEPKPWLRAGDVLTVEQMLYALLVRSANSAAVALAEACSGSEKAFVAEMNKKAAELGMKDTHFANPNGLDAQGHYSTAADMATVARYAMRTVTFRRMVSTKEYSLSLPGRQKALVFENTNELLGKVDWVTGIKTGLTPRAEQCLVCSGTLDGVSVISVVLGQPVPEVCFSESKKLMQYGFSQYRHVTLLSKGAMVAEAEVPYRLDGRAQLVTENVVEMELYKDDAVTTSVVLERDLVLPVRQGEVFGHVDMTVDGKVVGTVDLVAAQSYDKTTLGGKIAYFFGRLGRWLGGLV